MHGFLDEICAKNILRFQDYSKVWTIEEWKNLKCSWSSCLRLFIEDNISLENVSFSVVCAGIVLNISIQLAQMCGWVYQFKHKLEKSHLKI
jgi:hypothetical protein